MQHTPSDNCEKMIIMKHEPIAILADIHANLPAFKACPPRSQRHGAKQIVTLGDIVGSGTEPAECVALCMKLGVTGVMGNYEISALSRRKPEVFGMVTAS